MPSDPERQKRAVRTRREERATKVAMEAILSAPDAPVVRRKGTTPRQKRRNELRRLAKANPDGSKRMCNGLNIFGEPCKMPPLKKGTIVEGSPASGDSCLFHDTTLPPDTWKRHFQEKGTQTVKAQPRTVSPMELLAQAVAKAPSVLFESHLRAIGKEWDADTGTVVQKYDKEGRPDLGARIVGFSREGVARVSRHRNLEVQMRAENYLADRLWGKPRQSVDVAGDGIGAAVMVIPMDANRANAVATILQQAGALFAPPVQQDGEADPSDD
jgi:hypothetical protein